MKGRDKEHSQFMHQSVNDVIPITVNGTKPGNVVHGEVVSDRFELLDMVMDRSAHFYNIKIDLRGFVYEPWKWLDRLIKSLYKFVQSRAYEYKKNGKLC